MSGIREKEWEKVQIQAFSSWMNSYLNKQNSNVQDITRDLSDGVKLIQFLELLSGTQAPFKYHAKPSSRIYCIENVHQALEWSEHVLGVKSVNVSAEDLVGNNIKIILGYLWALFSKYRIAVITQDDKSSSEGLLLWCKKMAAPYQQHFQLPIQVNSFKDSFQNGWVLLALCATCVSAGELPKAGNTANTAQFDQFKKLLASINNSNNDDSNILTGGTAVHRLETAFSVAEKELGIPKLLTPQDVVEGNVDERSLLVYISMFFHAFIAKQQQQQEQQAKSATTAQLQDDNSDSLSQNDSANNNNVSDRKESETALREQLQAANQTIAELKEKNQYLEEKVVLLKQLLAEETASKDDKIKALKKKLKKLKAQQQSSPSSTASSSPLSSTSSYATTESKKKATK